MHAALQPLLEAGWLEAQPTSPDEIRGLLGIVDRRLDELNGSLNDVSDREARDLAAEAARLGETVKRWLVATNPELVPS